MWGERAVLPGLEEAFEFGEGAVHRGLGAGLLFGLGGFGLGLAGLGGLGRGLGWAALGEHRADSAQHGREALQQGFAGRGHASNSSLMVEFVFLT
jgi:hypothetical protein